jgi:hypothetical protein
MIILYYVLELFRNRVINLDAIILNLVTDYYNIRFM